MAHTSYSLGSPRSPVRGNMRIPKDQAALLDRSDSWISSLESSNNPLGLVNLPANILRSLTDYHRRRLQNRLTTRKDESPRKLGGDREAGRVQESEGAEESTPAPTTPEAGVTESPTATGARAPVLNNTAYDSQEQPSSSPEVPIDWSPSPTREVGKFVTHRSSPETSPAPTTAQLQLPSSSLDTEEELEVVVPHGVRDTTRPTNQETHGHLSSSPSPRYTSSRPPPCGQGGVYSIDAYVDKESEEDNEAELKPMAYRRDVPGRRGRRMQPPVDLSSNPVTVQPTAHLGNRFATAWVPPAAHHLSMLDISQASLSNKSTPTSPAKDIPSSREDASEPRKRRNSQTPNTDLDYEPSSKKPRTSCSDSANEGSACRDVLVPATPSEGFQNLVRASGVVQPVRRLKPFDTYRERYPEYQGTLDDFIRACICLEYLQQEDLMRDLLYDDFIHAFAGGYVNYVAAFPVDPLPAHRWFNRLGGKIVFDKMVITRQNLRQVFETFPEEFLAVKSDQSPQRRTMSPTPMLTLRPGSAREAFPRFREPTTPTPKGHLEQRVPATLPRANRIASEVRVPWGATPFSQHTKTIHHGDGPVASSSQAPTVIPATQSPDPTAGNQKPWPKSTQDLQHQVKGKRPLHPQTPYSTVAESPLKRVVTPRSQPLRSPPLHGHPSSEAVFQNGLDSEKRVAKLSVSKITSTAIIPVAIQRYSSNEDLTPTTTTAQAPKKAEGPSEPQNEDNQHGRPSAEMETMDVYDSNGSPTVRDVVSSSHPYPRIREDDTSMKRVGTPDRSSERRRARSPDLHSSAYTSPSPPRPNGHSDDKPVSSSPAPAKPLPIKKGPTSIRREEMDTRGSRHSIATGNPRASSGNDALKKVASGRVQKETGRKSLDSKDGRKGTDRKASGGKSSEKRRRMTREEAMQEFIRRKHAEKASASPATRP